GGLRWGLNFLPPARGRMEVGGDMSKTGGFSIGDGGISWLKGCFSGCTRCWVKPALPGALLHPRVAKGASPY
ncbi:MAG: hypothetical protein ACPL4H_08400, partial [Anaerolineales bacterium]